MKKKKPFAPINPNNISKKRKRCATMHRHAPFWPARNPATLIAATETLETSPSTHLRI